MKYKASCKSFPVVEQVKESYNRDEPCLGHYGSHEEDTLHHAGLGKWWVTLSFTYHYSVTYSNNNFSQGIVLFSRHSHLIKRYEDDMCELLFCLLLVSEHMQWSLQKALSWLYPKNQR